MSSLVVALHPMQLPLWYVSYVLPICQTSSFRLTAIVRFLRLPTLTWISLQHTTELLPKCDPLPMQHGLVLYHLCMCDVPGSGGLRCPVRASSTFYCCH